MLNERRDYQATEDAVKALGGRKWAVAAAVSLCSQELQTRQAIVSAGEGEFLRVARSKFAGQGFSQFDLKQIFRAIQLITEIDQDPCLVKPSQDLVTRVSQLFEGLH